MKILLLSVEILRLLLLPCWFSYQTNEDKIRIFAALILLILNVEIASLIYTENDK